MIIEIIGYWCLFVGMVGEFACLVVSIKQTIDAKSHMVVALYFIAAILALK